MNSIWKYYFDLIITISGAYSVFENTLFACFGIPDNLVIPIIDIIIDVMFLIDLILKFFTEYH